MSETVDFRDVDDDDLRVSWLWRNAIALEAWARPAWGWGVLVACMLLAMLPAIALRANRWLELGDFQTTLEASGPMAVATVWLIWGWREPGRRRFGWYAPLLVLFIGIVVLSQLLLSWIPGPRVMIAVATTGDVGQVPAFVVTAWMRAATRFVLWQQGVAAGGAAQDNLVFATIGASMLWLLGLATAWLARGVRQGLAAGAPSLWLLGLILLYSSGGKFLLLAGLALTLALHILLEQGVLMLRWQQMGLDYSPGLLVDRLVAVLSAGAVVLTLAAVMPNLYIEPLVTRYYEILAPTHLAMEEFGERLFPELRGTSRLRGGDGGGMPNDFLLRGGPNLGSAVVMRVRTDEAAPYQVPYDETLSPPSHYMRARTLTVYDGRGWSNPDNLEHAEIDANQRWAEDAAWGRKQLVQSVILEANTSVLLAAAEPVEASAAVRLETRSEDDLVAVQARESSYTVVSMVPAVSEAQLRELPVWTTSTTVDATGALPLPEDLAVHLEVPASVTERTLTLAAELVDGQLSNYDKARTIEQYLRQYTYDLEVAEPPNNVTDVADYFLFELQRGYCDYYATAFVVLARLSGLPARFATGYTAGQWDPLNGQFVISENNAHSWPEVYFPEVGWVPFEPTAARSELLRIALPESRSSSFPPPVVTPDPVDRGEQAGWNWQLLVWILPLVALVWAGWQGWHWWRRQREDPWQSLLHFGRRAGRPIEVGETVLEYGQGLAGHVLLHQSGTADVGRIAAREIEAMSGAVNRLRYGREDERREAQSMLNAHWSRLREYLRLIRIR